MMGEEAVREAQNRYTVHVSDQGGWTVQIHDPSGQAVHERACGDETEARTYASTIQQHVYWLSEEKFRSYYKLGEPGTEA
ncbi:MAG: hypothetical protein LC722_01080 [Actinobacteria bacterium]|nr:hypothetical protein [Actinomycetota bacterium]